MKKFLAVFLGSPDAMKNYMAQDDEMREANDKKGMEAWMAWVNDNKSSILEMGSPLGNTKKVDKSGISDVRNEMGAWCVVEATTHEEAAKIFVNHPHFTVFPGERVEVMEMLPVPGM